jgi:hypothetical protein
MALRDRLVDNADEAWRWLSMRFVAVAFAWEMMPPEVTSIIPDPYNGWLTAVLLFGAALGRVYKQAAA